MKFTHEFRNIKKKTRSRLRAEKQKRPADELARYRGCETCRTPAIVVDNTELLNNIMAVPLICPLDKQNIIVQFPVYSNY
jgi:hypothetical protein